MGRKNRKDILQQKAKPQIGLGLFILILIIGLFLTFWSFKIGQNQHPNAQEVKLSAPDAKIPEGIVQIFYEEYKRQQDLSKDSSKDNLSSIIGETPYITDGLRKQILSSHQSSSLDPIICSQNMPLRFQVKTTQMHNNVTTTVMVRAFYTNSEIMIINYLKKVDGWWRVDRIECLNFPM